MLSKGHHELGDEDCGRVERRGTRALSFMCTCDVTPVSLGLRELPEVQWAQ